MKTKINLRTIPGVGKSIEQDLIELGYRSVSDLKGADPEKMYERFCKMKGQHIDRCLLYVFRCAVYFVSNKKHDPKKLKWWNWKEKQQKSMQFCILETEKHVFL